MTRPVGEPLLEVSELTKVFAGRGGILSPKAESVRAVDGVTFSLQTGETLGIVGESGSGKTTLVRTMLRLIPATTGSVRLLGREILDLTDDETRTFVRPNLRMIFQHPQAVLNPGRTIGRALAQPLELYDPQATPGRVEDQVVELLSTVGLESGFKDKSPRELSGGEKRRVGLCRALATTPKIIVADEPISGLDVLLQERVLRWLKREQAARRFGLIIISHDLERVNQVCDRVLVMYRGKVVEDLLLDREASGIVEQFRHPYSLLLQRSRIDLIARSRGSSAACDGFRPEPGARPAGPSLGCAFRGRCDRWRRLGRPDRCATEQPTLSNLAERHRAACHFAETTVRRPVPAPPFVPSRRGPKEA